MSFINKMVEKKQDFEIMSKEILELENDLKIKKLAFEQGLNEFAKEFDEDFDGSLNFMSILLDKSNMLIGRHLKRTEAYLKEYGVFCFSRRIGSKKLSVSLDFNLNDKKNDLGKTLKFLKENYIAIKPEKEILFDEENQELINGNYRVITFDGKDYRGCYILIDENGRFQLVQIEKHPEKDILKVREMSKVFEIWEEMVEELVSW